MKLLPVEDARARMLAAAARMPGEDVALEDALGRTLAEPVVAGRSQPPFAASAMDGWAVRAADCPGTLEIVGESAAGHAWTGTLAAGQAVRIFTGAAVPDGADWIVIQEDARRDGAHVTVPAAAGSSYIRPEGGDFAAGTGLLPAGVRLDPWRLTLAASAGRARLTVARRPRVVVLSTGEEVVEPGGAPGPFQIYNSGTTALAALLRSWGAEPVALASVGDDEAAIADPVAAAGGDLVVTLGGASVGDHDLVKPALGRLGLTMAVESIAVRPGKPTWFGTLADGRRVLGLPGNPASAMVCAQLFLRPLVLAMQGADPATRIVRARSAAALAANGPREHWMRAKLSWAEDGAVVATPFRDQDSSLVTVFAEADALLRRPVGASAVAAGEPVDMLILSRA
ncbi:gephyrin-like molybdotransferase Glp [Caulobacter sp. KR2-114]|uniref:molybdopterin molybdotransferase MoeA n=1 Tax=Caulobacter sp. KR2-114 TaxID=3400912 RepID=UPI003C09E247